MDKHVIGARLGAVAFVAGLSMAGPQAVSAADTGEAGVGSQAAAPARPAAERSSAPRTRADRAEAAGEIGGIRSSTGRARSAGPAAKAVRVAAAEKGGSGTPPASDVSSGDTKLSSRAAAAVRHSSVAAAAVARSDEPVVVTAGAAEPVRSARPGAAAAASAAALRDPVLRRVQVADHAVPPVLTTLNTAVTNFFDQTARLLSTLPAPVAEFLQGGLLLVRRTFFNQAPTAVPVQYEQTRTQIRGGIDATDLEGEPITYTVVSKPKYGDIQLDAETGRWEYTPPAFDRYGGSDSFTVELANPGFHLNLLGPRSATVVVPISISGVDVLKDTTQKFVVLNRTSKSLYYRAQESGHVDSGPQIGTEVKPGEEAAWEVVKYGFKLNDVRVAFGSAPSGDPASMDWYAVTLRATSYVDFTEHDSARDCYASGGNKCRETGYPLAYFLDPPDTVITVAAAEKQRQADILNQLCRSGGAATCDYDVKDVTNLAPDFATKKQVGSDAYNRSDGGSSKAFSYSFTESATTSWEVSGEASGTLAKLVAVKVSSKTAKSWTESATVGETVTQNLLPWSYGVVEAAPYLSNIRGDFTAEMGNTTWILKDVVYTLPTADNCSGKACLGSFVLQQQPLQEGFAIKDPDSSTPYTPVYAVGERQQLQTTAFNGVDFTTRATYTSSDPSVATANPTGVVQTKAPGTTTITATYTWTLNNIGPVTLTKAIDVTVK